MRMWSGVGLLAAMAAGLLWWILAQPGKDQGMGLAMAYGNVKDDGSIEVVTAIDMPMTIRDGPRLDERGNQMWPEWVTDHFSLRDASDTPVELTRIGHSPLVDERYVGGAPDFYLQAMLRIGAKYTFDYRPKLSGAKVYRLVFTAPAEKQRVARPTFELVSGK